MGVIAVRNDKDIWGAASRFIYSIVVFGISKLGEKEYLKIFKNQFDWGYNGIDLYTLNDADHSEFLWIVKEFMKNDISAGMGYDREQVVSYLKDLIERMEAAEADRTSTRKNGT